MHFTSLAGDRLALKDTREISERDRVCGRASDETKTCAALDLRGKTESRGIPAGDETRRPVIGSRTGAPALRPPFQGSRSDEEHPNGDMEGGINDGDPVMAPVLAVGDASPWDTFPNDSSSSERSPAYDDTCVPKGDADCVAGDLSELFETESESCESCTEGMKLTCTGVIEPDREGDRTLCLRVLCLSGDNESLIKRFSFRGAAKTGKAKDAFAMATRHANAATWWNAIISQRDAEKKFGNQENERKKI